MLVFNWDAPPAFADFYTAKTGRRVSMFLWPLSRIRYAWTSWFFTAKWRRFLCCRRIWSTEENTLHPICAITSRTDVYFLPLRINKRTSPVTLPSPHYCVIFDLHSVVFLFFIRLPNHLRSFFHVFFCFVNFLYSKLYKSGFKTQQTGIHPNLRIFFKWTVWNYCGWLAFLRLNIIGRGAHMAQQMTQTPPTMWKHMEKLCVNTWM